MSVVHWRGNRFVLLFFALVGTLGSTWCLGFAVARGHASASREGALSANSARAARGLAGRARVSVSAARVLSPGLVTVRGSGWTCSAGVKLEAFVVGISPYRPTSLGIVGARRGRFSKRWRTPVVSDSLRWTVQATQRCGSRTVVKQAGIEIEAAARFRRAADRQAPSLSAILAAVGATTIDPAGLQLIADYEGYRLNKQGLYIVYNDSSGFCTAGYGHLLHYSRCDGRASEAPYNNLTSSQAVALLQRDANRAAAFVASKVTIPLSQTQLDALVALEFNIGPGGFAGSMLLRDLNNGKLDQVPDQFKVWDEARRRDGSKGSVAGLTIRRTGEAKLFTSGTFPKVKHPLPTGGGQTPPPQDNPCKRPNHGGGIDLLLMGEFFGTQWAAGAVTATPSDGSGAETANVGRDYVSDGHFGPWKCGSTATLVATPTRGNHFDRWKSGEGICATAGATCTVPITTTTYQLTAYFAPTVYKLSVTNNQPDGVVYSRGGGYEYPDIKCGSKPNGSTVTLIYTDCTSGAIAQRSDTDVTQLEIDADSRGPGERLYGVASVDGCDRSIATNDPVPGGTGTYVASVQCFIDMNSDRAITVAYKDVGPAH